MFKKEKLTYKLLKNNRKKGLEKMYKLYGSKLCAYGIGSWNLSEDDSWDIVYKTMYKIEKNIDNYTFENEAKFSSFIYKVFINYLRNFYRDNKNKEKKIQITEINNEFDIEDKNNTEEPESNEIKQLNNELAKLEDWQRMLLLLRAQDMPYSEIAKYINKPEKQLKVYYGRLKTKITKQLKERKKERKEFVYEKQ